MKQTVKRRKRGRPSKEDMLRYEEDTKTVTASRLDACESIAARVACIVRDIKMIHIAINELAD